MLHIERRLVAGVPAFVGDSDGPLVGGLMFRVGRADETGPTAGVTHLVEHLLLPAGSRSTLEPAASVDNIYVNVMVRGPADEVGGLLTAVASTLRVLPTDRLQVERDVLSAEAAAGGFHANRFSFALRYGAVGHGLIGYDEWGLDHVTPVELQRWADDWFSSGNCAAWFTGEPPADFALDLPPGQRREPPAPRAIPYLSTPSLYSSAPPGGVLFTLAAPRSTALAMAVELLEHRLTDRLRHELGLVYGVEVVRTPLTKDEAHIAVSMDATPANARRVTEETLTTLRRLASDGPTVDELDRGRERRRAWASDPVELPGWAGYFAAQELVGAEHATIPQLVQESDAVTADDLARALNDAADSLLVVAPEETAGIAGLEPYPLASPRRVEGRRFKSHAWFGATRRAALIVGDLGVTLQAADGTAITAEFPTCALLLQHPDGSRLVVSDDGFFVPVDPDLWRKGKQAVALIDAAVDPAVVVSADPGLGERRALVERVAGQCLDNRRFVGDELASLPNVLEQGEELRLVAKADRAWRSGLVALTDRRLLFLYLDGVNADVPLDVIRGAESRDKDDPSLLLDTDDPLDRLTHIKPTHLAPRLAALLSRPAPTDG